MEVKTIAIDHCCCDLFTIIDITQSIENAVGLSVGVPPMKFSIHKDNAGALILARNVPPKFTPHSNYYATKTIWFCEESNKRKIALLKIATVEYLGDLFTKGLLISTFEYLWNK